MKIGIIGGTGGMGKGFALRWSHKHDIIIGSRDKDRAAAAASQYADIAKEAHTIMNGTISGYSNIQTAKESDVLVLSIPYKNIVDICSDVCPHTREDCTVISPVVPMIKTDVGFEFIPIKEGRPFSHELISKYVRDKTRLVSAFHVISEKKLVNPALELDYDIFVCGDNKDSIDIVNGLISEIRGLRPIYLGPGELAYLAEISTPLLLNAMIRNNMKNPGIKIV